MEFNKKIQIEILLKENQEKTLKDFLKKYDLLDQIKLNDKIIFIDKSILHSKKCRGI